MGDKQTKRRLAAIVAADVVGYCRLMSADEERTLHALQAHRSELIDPTVANHGGRIVKTMGDGLLLEFDSIFDAVRCSTEIQNAMRCRNADVAPEQRIEFRVGVNVGDIIIDGEDIFGEGVNIAARLEGIADPGGVCLSEAALQQVSGRLDLVAEDMGERSLKNIDRPVRAFRVREIVGGEPNAESALNGPSQSLLPLPVERPSLAVEPQQVVLG